MPRSIWNGTITFGLTAVPIKMTSATEDRSVHFHQMRAKEYLAIIRAREEATDADHDAVRR